MIIEISLLIIGLIFLWLFLRLIIKKRSEKDTSKKVPETERLGEEIHYRKEMKKHLGFHVDREEIPFSEEEPCYDAIADEEDEEDN